MGQKVDVVKVIKGLLGGCCQVTLALSQSIVVAPVSFNGQEGIPVYIRMLNTVSYNEINRVHMYVRRYKQLTMLNTKQRWKGQHVDHGRT